MKKCTQIHKRSLRFDEVFPEGAPPVAQLSFLVPRVSNNCHPNRNNEL